MTRHVIATLAAAVLASVALIRPAAAQSLGATELKAAYLFKFAQFVEWPADVVPAGSALTMCIVNDDSAADAVDRTIKGRTVDGHGVTVRRFAEGAPLPKCHILYLAGRDLKRSLGVVQTLEGAFVLTVGDAARFADGGGMVEFFLDSGRMRFAINTAALQRGNVRLSSRVLGLGKIVRDDKAR